MSVSVVARPRNQDFEIKPTSGLFHVWQGHARLFRCVLNTGGKADIVAGQRPARTDAAAKQANCTVLNETAASLATFACAAPTLTFFKPDLSSRCH
jgi:hypothetical protein